MSETTATLSNCWAIEKAIEDVIVLLEPTCDSEASQALKFLNNNARWFLQVADGALFDSQMKSVPAIESFKELLRDILKFTTDYYSNTRLMGSTVDTRRILLDLNTRFSFFVETYMIHSATNARIEAVALLQPLPSPPSDRQPLIPDDIQWDIMCRRDHHPSACDRTCYEQFMMSFKAEDVASTTVMSEDLHNATWPTPCSNEVSETKTESMDVSQSAGLSSERRHPGKYEAQSPPMISSSANNNNSAKQNTGSEPDNDNRKTPSCLNVTLCMIAFPISIPMCCCYMCFGDVKKDH